MAPRSLLIIGAPKSGTSSLIRWLDGHPACSAPARGKEPRHFTDFAERTWTGPFSDRFPRRIAGDPEAYEALYRDAPPEAWRIDASTDYLWCPVSAERIRRHADEGHEVRLICVLRDPVERAFSEYSHTIRDRMQTESFAESLRLEPQRIRDGWVPLFRHVLRSSYAEQVARYRALFGPDELLVLGYGELADRGAAMRRICGFLGIPPIDVAAEPARNASYADRSRLLGRLTRSAGVKRVARMVVPARYRDRVYRQVSDLNRTKLRMTAEEHAFALGLLEDQIRACREMGLPGAEGWGRFRAPSPAEAKRAAS